MFIDNFRNMCAYRDTGVLCFEKVAFWFRPATAVQYNRMFRDFLCHLEMVQVATCQVKTVVILSYMEFLHQKGLSHTNISNHLTAIRATFIMYGLNTDPFRDERIPLFIKALRINAPLSLRHRKLLLFKCFSRFYRSVILCMSTYCSNLCICLPSSLS